MTLQELASELGITTEAAAVVAGQAVDVLGLDEAEDKDGHLLPEVEQVVREQAALDLPHRATSLTEAARSYKYAGTGRDVVDYVEWRTGWKVQQDERSILVRIAHGDRKITIFEHVDGGWKYAADGILTEGGRIDECPADMDEEVFEAIEAAEDAITNLAGTGVTTGRVAAAGTEWRFVLEDFTLEA